MRDQTEVCPLSRGVMLLVGAQLLSGLLLAGLRLLRPPLPAAPSAFLTVCFPWRGRYGLTKFRLSHKNGLGALYPPVVLLAHVTRHINS
jgi:hypothetical protein